MFSVFTLGSTSWLAPVSSSEPVSRRIAVRRYIRHAGVIISYIHDACLFFQGFYFSVPPKITTQNDGSMVLLPDNPTIAWLFGVIDAGIESSDV